MNSKADSVHSTEAAISARLRRCGMRIERRGEGYVLLHSGKLILAKAANGTPLTLAQIDDVTRRFV